MNKAAGAPDPLEVVMRYHQETKHHFSRYARGPGGLDWANQPDPFRRYAGAPLLPLPILGPHDKPVSPPYDHLYGAARSSAPLSLRTLSRLFEYALALSAWKQVGEVRWALRSNPSSGNLHPTEGYLLIGALRGLSDAPGLYHYAPREHALERRAALATEPFARLMRAFPPHAFLVALSSVHWREAWKYGERAFRYCQHDVGHAIGALRIAAATLGWRALVLDGLSDVTLEILLGVNRVEDYANAEREHADLVLLLWPAYPAGPDPGLPLFLEPASVRALAAQAWYGKANRLSRGEPLPWPIIDAVTLASRKFGDEQRWLNLFEPTARREPEGSEQGPQAGTIIHQRRSLLACDGKTSLPAARFYQMLARVMPRRELEVLRRSMPWDAIPWSPAVHLGLFVHRVDGLEPGLYLLARDPGKVPQLRRATHPRYAWERPPGCPADVPLYLLERGDVRRLATEVSCLQEIAGEGVFSLGMIAEYREMLSAHGPWFYRRLFWETGLIGQVLYLEAEAAGVRATGIGCFFDEPVHQVFGFRDLEFQSLYHFTVGGPVDDLRLTTLPPYGFPLTGEERGADLP